jgi:hypothetical protein
LPGCVEALVGIAVVELLEEVLQEEKLVRFGLCGGVSEALERWSMTAHSIRPVWETA